MAAANAELASWVRRSPFLKAVEVETGEVTMALLLLWEVEHGRTFPAKIDGDNRAAMAAGFGRRLQAQVQKDDELRGWLVAKRMQCAVQAGAPAVHQLRWSLRVVRPAAGDPGGFYDKFVTRWKEYVASLLTPAAAATPRTRGRTVGQDGDEPGVKRRRAAPPERPAAAEVESSPPRRRERSPAAAVTEAPKRQRTTDLRGWLQPRSARTDETLSGHGRATTGSTH